MQRIQIIAFLMAVISGNATTTPVWGGPNTPFRPLQADNTTSINLWQMSPPTRANLKPASQSSGFTKTAHLWPTGDGADPNLSTSTNSAGTRELFSKMMVSVVLVVVLGAVAIYASKRLVGKIANLPGKKIKIIETTHLGPKKAVHLLRIGDRCLLIGSTNDNITKLADVTTEIVMHEKGLSEDTDPTDTHKTGPATEFGPVLEPADALADLSTTYSENN